MAAGEDADITIGTEFLSGQRGKFNLQSMIGFSGDVIKKQFLAQGAASAKRTTGVTNKLSICLVHIKMAESQGFEPWVPVRIQRFSRPSRSTAPATLHFIVFGFGKNP